MRAKLPLAIRSEEGQPPFSAFSPCLSHPQSLLPSQVLPVGVDEAQSGIHGTVSHMPPEAMEETTFGLATDVSA